MVRASPPSRQGHCAGRPNANEDGWADVGHGTVDWAGLIKAFREKSAAKVYVMEHDNPSDVERFARRSIEAANKY